MNENGGTKSYVDRHTLLILGNTAMATAERTLQVLLVEDDDDQAMLIERQIRQAADGSIQITRVDRLAAGIQKLRESSFHSVLLDLNLPDSRGLSTCYQLCDAAPDVPVIAMTALDMVDDGIRLVRERAEDYFPKFRMAGDLMVRAIHCAVERTERRRAQAQLHLTAGQLEAARRIQTALLPSQPPAISGFDTAAAAEPAQAVGGDYYDFMFGSNGRVLIALGDVEGHGPAAAMMMAVATGSLRTAFMQGGDAGDLLTRVNAVLESFPPRNTLMTMLLVELDVATRTARYATAAHPFGYVFDTEGNLKTRMNSGNDVPLGIVAEHQYAAIDSISLASGETLVMVSDGLLDAGIAQHRPFGEQRLFETISRNYRSSAKELVAALLQAGTQHRQGHPAEDDVTVVVCRAT